MHEVTIPTDISGHLSSKAGHNYWNGNPQGKFLEISTFFISIAYTDRERTLVVLEPLLLSCLTGGGYAARQKRVFLHRTSHRRSHYRRGHSRNRDSQIFLIEA